jgi:WD40 repeat protein
MLILLMMYNLSLIQIFLLLHQQIRQFLFLIKVSFWDIRSGLCVSTLYGHLNSVNKVRFSLKGDLVASCDSDGVVKVWDTRMVKEKLFILLKKLI